MRLLVCEAICGGASGDLVDSSLQAEGAAMLCAAIDDFGNIPDCRVTTLWDKRMGMCPITDADVITVCNLEEATRMFRRSAANCDATFDIAPELDGLLLQRRQVVVEGGGSYLGSSTAAIELCADKLRMAEHLANCGIPTINTWLPGDVEGDLDRMLPVVLKRRDGAGSLSMQLIRDTSDWLCACELFDATAWNEQMIVQPFIVGRAVSTAAILDKDVTKLDVFPAGEQILGGDGLFQYRGGIIPAVTFDQEAIITLVRNTVKVIPGLAGYVGFDILLPEGSPENPLLVEINPRLTTSYLGYRAMTDDNLAERLLKSQSEWQPIRWNEGGVEFDTGGAVRRWN